MNQFFANIFELWGFNNFPISTDLYDNNIYSTVGLTLIFVTLLLVLTYYFIINSPRYARFFHWLLLLLFSSVGVTLFAILYPMRLFDFNNLGYIFGEYVSFGLTVFFFSSLLFFLLSLAVKHFSVNCSKTPF